MERTVIIIPCCATKSHISMVTMPPITIFQDLPLSHQKLLRIGRERVATCLDGTDTTPCDALYMYTGNLYRPLRDCLDGLQNGINQGDIRIAIVSAGYGLVNANESIQKYDLQLKDFASASWRYAKLDEVIGEWLLSVNPTRIYGYIAGKPILVPSAPAYRHFFTAGVKYALERGLRPKIAGCFYCHRGQGAGAILKALGKTICSHFRADFHPKAAKLAMKIPFVYGKVEIRFDRIDIDE